MRALDHGTEALGNPGTLVVVLVLALLGAFVAWTLWRSRAARR